VHDNAEFETFKVSQLLSWWYNNYRCVCFKATPIGTLANMTSPESISGLEQHSMQIVFIKFMVFICTFQSKRSLTSRWYYDHNNESHYNKRIL